MPLVLAVILVILALILRALVAPLILVATVVLSYLASLGAGSLLFQHVFGFAAIDYPVPLMGLVLDLPLQGPGPRPRRQASRSPPPALGVVGAGVSPYGAEVVVLPSTTELGEAEQSAAPPVRMGSARFERLLHLGFLCRIAQLPSRRRQRSLRVGLA